MELGDVLHRFGKEPVSVHQALSRIRPGDRIFVGTACATPRALLNGLDDESPRLHDVQLLSFLTSKSPPRQGNSPSNNLKHVVFFVGTDHRELLKSRQAQYAPVSLAHIPELIKKGTLSLDAALIQVSAPNNHGYVSLGVSVDTTLTAALHAKKVVAEMNPNMPFTCGESCIHLDTIDSLITVETPVIEYEHALSNEISERIARYVSCIIEDHSTLQIGLGNVPNEMLKFLKKSRNLGIHSEVITEPVVDLIEGGIITGKAKTVHRGKIVTSFCMGTERLYRMIDHNPLFSFQPIEYVCDPSVIMANYRLVSVTQAWSIDLSGQVCSDQYKGELYSGVSAQLEFHRYASRTPGGKSIVCLCSTSEDQQESRIRPNLLEGEGVAIPRSEVHYIITEYGYAYLFGKTLHDRALSLIEIAHPQYRPWLMEEAKRLGYVPEDISLMTGGAYPEEEECTVYIKGGHKVIIRPAKASDVMGIQGLFYRLSPNDVYTRFFHMISSMPVSNAMYMCNVDYTNEMAFVAVLGGHEHGEVIGTSGYAVDPMDNLAEVAYMIRPDFQGQGLGTVLQKRMIEYARKQGLRGLKADILENNEPMIRLLHKISDIQLAKEHDHSFPASIEAKLFF
jgi:acyl-CoA hydrolase/RimJ/RimL family protein N-acetyltransferase